MPKLAYKEAIRNRAKWKLQAQSRDYAINLQQYQPDPLGCSRAMENLDNPGTSIFPTGSLPVGGGTELRCAGVTCRRISRNGSQPP